LPRSEHDTAERSRFFRALWPDGLPQSHELTLWNPTPTTFWHDSVDGIIRDKRMENTSEYFGVGSGYYTRAEADKRKARLIQYEIRGLPAVFADFDFKGGLEMAHVMEFLSAAPDASIIVHTGGGVHLYWLLTKPLVTPQGAENKPIVSLLAGWKNYVKSLPHGNMIDAMVIEPARVLRVPGSTNYKYPEKPKVEILFLDESIRYGVDEIPILEAAERDYSDNVTYLTENAGYEAGARNDTTFRWVTRYLRLFGATEFDHILDLAKVHNEYANKPPLEEHELFTTVRSGWKTWIEKNKGQHFIDLTDRLSLRSLNKWANNSE